MRKARSPAELGFTDHDRRRLATALHQAQDVRVYQRVQAVLLIAQGYSVDEVARIIGSQQRSVYYRMRRRLKGMRLVGLIV
jgi:Homeodomain-like domain